MARKHKHKRPFSFRIYNFGCALVGVAALIAGGIILVLSTYEQRIVTCTPPRADERIAPLIAPDALPPLGNPGDSAMPTIIGERRFDHAGRRLRITLAQGEQPEELTPAIRANWPSFGAACNQLTTSPAYQRLLPSADLIFQWANNREEAIAVGIEYAFVIGQPAARIPALATFLRELADMAPTDPRPGVTADAIAEFRAWIGYSLQQLGVTLPDVKADQLAKLDNEFSASTLFSRPHGLWAATPGLTAAYRATRVLMTPLSEEAVPAAMHAINRDVPRAREWREHYRRWLAVLHALHGPSAHARLTLAAALDDDAPKHSPLSLLPWRLHCPADSLVAAARLAETQMVKAAVTSTDAASALEPVSIGLAALAHDLAVGAAGRTPEESACWLDWRLAARLAALPMVAGTDQPGTLEASGNNVAWGEHFKLLRLTGQASIGLSEKRGTVVRISRGLGCDPPLSELNPASDAPVIEPRPAAYARLALAMQRLPALLQPHLMPAALEGMSVAQLPGVPPVSVAQVISETAWMCRALCAIASAEAGDVPPVAAQTSALGVEELSAMLTWLTTDFRIDHELSPDVRDAWPVLRLPDGRVMWIGINGVRLQPVRVAAISSGAAATQREWHLLLPVLDRRLRTTDSAPPTRGSWRLLDDWTSAAARELLTR